MCPGLLRENSEERGFSIKKTIDGALAGAGIWGIIKLICDLYPGSDEQKGQESASQNAPPDAREDEHNQKRTFEQHLEEKMEQGKKRAAEIESKIGDHLDEMERVRGEVDLDAQ